MFQQLKKLLIYPIPCVFLLFCVSCQKEYEGEKELRIRLNHYYTIDEGMFGPRMYWFVQDEEDFGRDKWRPFSSSIEGFDYELGHVYELIVLKKRLKETGNDEDLNDYFLQEVISKREVDSSLEFEIPLNAIRSDGFHTSYAHPHTEGVYRFLHSELLEFSCESLCSKLASSLDNSKSDEIIGVFTHSLARNRIKLVDIRVE